MAGSRPPARRRRISVRAKATASAVLAFGLVLVVAALAALVGQRDSLRREVAQAAQSRADSVARALESSVAPGIFVRVGDREIAQITNADGNVIAASPSLLGAPAINGADWPVRLILHPGDREQFLAQQSAIGGGDLKGGRVIIGRSLNSVTASMAQLGRMFAIGVPMLTVIAGLMTWVLVGGALRPIESMRREVEEMSGASLGQRLRPPGGRDEVARLAETLNSMLARLQRSQESQRRFVSDASHELRSPLAVLRQSAELARDYPRTMPKVELAETTLEETERMRRLVEGLLVLARSDELALAPAGELVDLEQVCRDLARGRPGPPLDASGLNPVLVRGDRALLTRLIRNLLDNAGRHAAGHVWLACALRDRDAIVTVDDDGAGIPEADRERVFERFTRLDEARTRDEGGSGLGLAIAREIAAAHHGSITATASPHGGARFEVALPAAT